MTQDDTAHSAEQIAEAIQDAGYDAQVWEGDYEDVERVYVKRTLSRGRSQDMGYVERDGDAWHMYIARQAGAIRSAIKGIGAEVIG